MKESTLSYEKMVLLIVTATSFVTPFMGSALNIAIPAIGQDFQASAAALSWVVTGYILSTVTCLLPAGRFADINGRIGVYITGIFVFSFATILCGLADSLYWLIGLRALQGIGSSMIFSTGIAILAAVYPPERRGKALGVTTASTYIGLSAGPVLGGFVCFHFGWRFIFWFSAALGFLMVFLAYRYLRRETGGSAGEAFDSVGCILYMSSFVATLYGLAFLVHGMVPLVTLCIGLFLLAGFFLYERQREHPLLEVRLFSENLTFAFSNLAAMITYSATFAVGFLASLYLQIVMDLDSRITGWVMLSQPLLMAVFSPFAGRLSDRVEPRIVASLGMAMTTVGLFLFVFISRDTPLFFVITDLSIIGLGFAFFSSPNNNAIMGAVGREKYGVAAYAYGGTGDQYVNRLACYGLAWRAGSAGTRLKPNGVGQYPKSPDGFYRIIDCRSIFLNEARACPLIGRNQRRKGAQRCAPFLLW